MTMAFPQTIVLSKKWMQRMTDIQPTVCEACGGDGIERCNNPDHGFISTAPGEIGRLGCPCCGSDILNRIKGSKCPECNGTGEVS